MKPAEQRTGLIELAGEGGASCVDGICAIPQPAGHMSPPQAEELPASTGSFDATAGGQHQPEQTLPPQE